MKNHLKGIVRFWNRRPLSQKIFLRFMAGISLVSVAILIFFPEYSKIVYLTFLSIPTNSFIPIPHEPLILYYAKIMHPVPIAFYGSLGAAISAFIDYYIVAKAFNHKKIAPLKEKNAFKKGVKYFKKMPFITVLLFSTGIIPVFYPIRILVPVSGYSMARYLFGIFLGRAIRFTALALFGYMLQLPTWVIVIIGVIMLLLTVWVPMENFIKRKFCHSKNGEENDDVERETFQVSA
ncbi:MAG: VTT domain-containing protein [Oligoflexia bacterium]|nr:VTT domain-containing protein [Oligoflexia bacterium]